MEATTAAAPAVKKRGGGGTEGTASKASTVRLPVQVTLEPDARWHAGIRQTLPEGVHGQLEEMKDRAERFVLPVRERQNGLTLATAPGLRERPDPNEEPLLHPLVALLSHNNSWYRSSVTDTLRAIAAPELAADLSALHTRADARFMQNAPAQKPGIRFVDSEFGGFSVNTTNTVVAFEERGLRASEGFAPNNNNQQPRKAAERAKALYDNDRRLREVAFFDDDPLDDEVPDAEPYGMAPGKYRLIQHLKANLGERFEQRHEQQRDFGENIPRRAVETITLKRLEELRFPVHGHWRGCKRGEQCIVHKLAALVKRPDYGYTEREYLSLEEEVAYLKRREAGIPVSNEADGPARLCVDDILYACQGYYHQTLASKRAPRECVNLFALEDGAYSRDYLLPENDAFGNPTGIEGNVPQFLANTRQFTRRKLPDGRDVSYLEDTGSVFRPSLSEANTCLGAPKARPFAGPFRFATAPLSVLLPRFRLERAAGPAAAWIAFLRECHPAVLADRATLARFEDALDESASYGSASRKDDDGCDHSAIPLLPVVWLRRAIDLTSFRADGGELTPQATRMTLRIFDTADTATVGALLCRWVDIALCSFERSVSLWLNEARQGNVRLTIAPIALILGAPCYARSTCVFWSKILDHGRGLHVPRIVQRALATAPRNPEAAWNHLAEAILGMNSDEARGETHVFWAVALFRCACAAYFNTAFYRRDPDASEAFDRYAHYFTETHTHLFAHMLRAPATCSDRHLFEPAPASENAPAVGLVQTLRPRAPWLALFYPSANRVLCAEELPDLAPALAYANPWYDMGSRKTQPALFPMIVLLFLVKVINSTCQRRGYMDILQRDIKSFPVIGRFLRLIVYCVLAGNLPLAQHRLPLAARARLAASFAPFANADVDAAFISWMRTKRMTVWFLVREYYFFHVANAWVLEHVFSDSRKWPRFKAIVRITNGEVRREIAAQLARGGHGGVDWENIEHVTVEYRDAKGRDHTTTTGLIMARHDCTLKQFGKLRKGRFEELFKSKTKGIEKKLNVDYVAAETWLNADGRLAACHLVAWYLAQRSHAESTSLKRQLVIETRWLKALGMSKEGLHDLRTAMFEYYEWDTCDESLKKKGEHIFHRRWEDYVLARAVFRLIELYRDQSVYILPIEQTLRQVHALRAALVIEPDWDTPPHLGRLLYCEGCHRWVSDVGVRNLVLSGEIGSTLKAYEAHRKRVYDDARVHAAQCGERVATHASAKRAALAAAASLAFGSNASGADVCSFRRVYMDPLDGKRYCTRGNLKAPDANDVAVAPRLIDDDGNGQEEQEEEEDPFEVLALGRMNVKQWLRKHGEAAAAAAAALKADAPLPEEAAAIDDAALLALRPFSCNHPLTEICLVGTYFRIHNRTHGICVYCGRPCEVLNYNKTALGLSCGRHALAAVYPDNHRLWLSLGVTRAEVLRAFSLPPPRHRCFACRSATAVRYLEAYDFQHCLFRVPLCLYHFLCCSALIPVAPRPTQQGGSVVVPPPLRIDHIMERVWAGE